LKVTINTRDQVVDSGKKVSSEKLLNKIIKLYHMRNRNFSKIMLFGLIKAIKKRHSAHNHEVLPIINR
jgi:hypothetical protein